MSEAGSLDRLRGWTAIARHLGTSARTAQRWEQRHALPVHREDDAVFALREELDLWVRSWMRYGALPEVDNERQAADADGPQELGSPAASREPAETMSVGPADAGLRGMLSRLHRSCRARWIAVPALLAVLAPVLWQRWHPDPPPPASWRISNRTLLVADASGRTLFVHDLGLAAPWPGEHAPDLPDQKTVRFLDLEGDGHIEVLVLVRDGGNHDGRLLCLEADGRLRFELRPKGSARFGSVDYTGPWLPNSVSQSLRPDGSRALWVNWIHMPWFPNRLQQISPRGEVLAEYWSNGNQNGVREVRMGGKDVLLVWGTDNEFRGASLAIFDFGQVHGHAPALKDDYLCRNCGEGGPREFLVFPRSCLEAREEHCATVRDARVDAEGRLHVTVQGGRRIHDGVTDYAFLSYWFGPTLALERVRLDAGFEAMHTLLEKQRLLDHALGPVDEDQLLPVLRWDGSRFAALPRVSLELERRGDGSAP